MKFSLENIAHPLRRYLQGGLSQRELSLELSHLHHAIAAVIGGAPVVSTSAGSSSSVALTALGLLGLLLDPAHSVPPARLKMLLACVAEKLEGDHANGLRRFLPRIFGELGPLHLCALENPLADSFSSDFKHEWIDVGLLPPAPAGRKRPDGFLEEAVQLIPFSVFTHRFFHEELPQFFQEGVVPHGPDRVQISTEWGKVPSPRVDRFYYHPENDQAIALRESYPALSKRRLGFQYFIDETGLSEIILHTGRIRRRELVFAAQLFCLKTGARRATLDGRLVAGIQGCSS